MMDVEQALLIILATFLALFLLLALIATYKFIQVLNSLKKITERAEHIADRAENLSDIFVKSSGPWAVGTLLSHIVETVFTKHKSKKGDK